MSASRLRNSSRETTWRQCLVRVDQRTLVRGLLTNVSHSGAELRCKYPFEHRQQIEVFSSQTESRRHAQIMRNDGNCFGVEWSQTSPLKLFVRSDTESSI